MSTLGLLLGYLFNQMEFLCHAALSVGFGN